MSALLQVFSILSYERVFGEVYVVFKHLKDTRPRSLLCNYVLFTFKLESSLKLSEQKCSITTSAICLLRPPR